MVTPDKKHILFIRKNIFAYAEVLYDSYAWRHTSNLYHALTAEIMLQRTRADQVLPVYLHFSEQYKTPKEYIEKGAENVFTSLGLLHRHKQFVLLSEKLASLDSFPTNPIEIRNLPGVGNYVASALLSLHLNHRQILIDSNIVRFYARFFGFPYTQETRREKKVYELGEKITPKKNFSVFNYALLDFTRKVCQPKPHCVGCRLRKKCVITTS